MEFSVIVNKNSQDGRVRELVRICGEKNIKVFDIGELPQEGKKILFTEPRVQVGPEVLSSLDAGDIVFGYAAELDLPEGIQYVSLSSDEKFIEENNRLTALAMREILLERFDTVNKKILVMGYGKLASQIEKVLAEALISVLNFNVSKKGELEKKYAERAFFETADLSEFEIIINTIPKQVIGKEVLEELLKSGKMPAVYDLASPPFGFDFGELDVKNFDYRVEPGLPGRFYPAEAAQAVFDCIQRHCGRTQCDRPLIVLGVTGSSCSFIKLLPVLKELGKSYEFIPVLSENAGKPNRFVNIEQFKAELREICGHNIITTIAGSETLSADRKIAGCLVFPATGNTVAKLANAVTDTCVTMAVKALLRNAKPCVIALSTNDALSGNAANIGMLLNRKNYYFVPFSQDDPEKKPFSVVCDFYKAGETLKYALEGKQLQPILKN